jgi:hypothetical protein
MSHSDDPAAEQERLVTESDLADPAAEAARRAVVIADSLTAALGAVSARLGEQDAALEKQSVYGRRSRKIMIALAISFALDIILTIVIGITVIHSQDTASAASATASQLHASNLTACASGNTFRADQDKIWAGFIGLITMPSPGESAARKAEVKTYASNFLTFVRTVNRLNNCTVIYGK